MKKRYGVLPLLLLAAMQAPAADKAPATKAKKPRMVCTDAPATGTHISRRNCVTQEQADERRRRDQDEMARMKPAVRTGSAAQ